MSLKLILTADGSHTLFREDIDEHYHSIHGAIQESMHVFIEKGLNEISKTKDKINILEIGFGTGLNALLTVLESEKGINYTGIEAFPIETEIIQKLNYSHQIDSDNSDEMYRKLHEAKWNKIEKITDNFHLNKKHETIQSVLLNDSIDLVYFDAFGPNVQPEMWEVNNFQKIYEAMSPASIFVTYCAKGQVRRDLQSVGFTVERLEGPPGKREMLRAWKL